VSRNKKLLLSVLAGWLYFSIMGWLMNWNYRWIGEQDTIENAKKTTFTARAWVIRHPNDAGIMKPYIKSEGNPDGVDPYAPYGSHPSGYIGGAMVVFFIGFVIYHIFGGVKPARGSRVG
jgi:hypothetical protein